MISKFLALCILTIIKLYMSDMPQSMWLANDFILTCLMQMRSMLVLLGISWEYFSSITTVGYRTMLWIHTMCWPIFCKKIITEVHNFLPHRTWTTLVPINVLLLKFGSLPPELCRLVKKSDSLRIRQLHRTYQCYRCVHRFASPSSM